LLLDAREVGEIEPLHGLLRVRGRPGEVEAVRFRHLDELLERADLLGELFAIADDVIGRHRVVEPALLLFLALDKTVDAVQRDAAIVADDAAAAVSVGQPREDV
jgi:hypothetical protein